MPLMPHFRPHIEFYFLFLTTKLCNKILNYCTTINFFRLFLAFIFCLFIRLNFSLSSYLSLGLGFFISFNSKKIFITERCFGILLSKNKKTINDLRHLAIKKFFNDF